MQSLDSSEKYKGKKRRSAESPKRKSGNVKLSVPIGDTETRGGLTLEELTTISNRTDECINRHSSVTPPLSPRHGERTPSPDDTVSDNMYLHIPTRSGHIHRGVDRNRELIWSTDIENVIKEWHNRCLTSANWHVKKAKKHRKIFYILSIPAAIIPMSLASASETLDEEYKHFIAGCLILTGGLNIIAGFLNSGKVAESHLNFSALYNELAVELTSELVKPRTNRQVADVFIQRIMDRYNSLNNRAPAS